MIVQRKTYAVRFSRSVIISTMDIKVVVAGDIRL